MMSQVEQLCRQFSLDEIKKGTNNFDDKLIIGKGGFGLVYIGWINNGGELVAMKRLSRGSTQGETEFLREIETLSNLQHDHLVRLRGYCNQFPEMILVYEYMPNGTLADHLYKTKDLGSTSADGDKQQSYLTWEQRLSICIGAARGLDYLHREYVPGIIHRDIKDSNILLDGNFVAKIADFGLAKLVKTSSELQTTIVSSTGVKGTFGYLDPDYFYTQRLSKKTDVYAFGVLLLVVLCGRPATDSRAAEDQRGLAEWAQNSIHKNKVDQIIDPQLAGKISSTSLKQFIKVSQKCLCRQSEKRPTMEEVVSGLELALKKQPNPLSSSKQPNGRSSLTKMLVKFQILAKGQSDLAKGQPGIENKSCQQFSLYGIKTATQNFSEELIIGQGDLGTVYIGRLNSGSEVAIRKTAQGETEFCRGTDIIWQRRHNHVISLKGYCKASTEMVLVYEHMSKGTLEKHMCKLGDNQQPRLSWEQRLHICICAARGFDLLNQVIEPGVIYRKVNECSSIMSNGDSMADTLGCIDPNHIFMQEVTTQSDVYGFGVFMLLVLSETEARENVAIVSQKHFQFRPKELIEKNKCLRTIDRSLLREIKYWSLERFLSLADQCMSSQSRHRPTMEKVVKELELALEFQLDSASTLWIDV